MSIEHVSGSLLEAPPEGANDPESTESVEPQPEKIKEFEVNLVGRVLREEIARKFAGRFEQDVKQSPKDKRGEALIDFKAAYLKHQLNLADAITRTQKLMLENPDLTARELETQVDWSMLEGDERAQVLDIARQYERQAIDLKSLVRGFWPEKVYAERREWRRGDDGTEGWAIIRGEEIVNPEKARLARKRKAKQELFRYLTGEKLEMNKNFSLKRRGNNLICYAEPGDFADLFAGNATGEERQSLIKQSWGAAGFHRVEKRKHPVDGRDVIFHTIAISRGFGDYWGDVIHYHPDALEQTLSHESQHAFDSNLEIDRGTASLDFPFREDLENHLSQYVGSYLDKLRDEAIAHVIEGHGQSLAKADYTSEKAFYFYPKPEQLEPYRTLLGEERFQEWQVEEIWEEKVVKPFRSAADDIARISARLASTPKQQRDKLAALFEIEPAEKWQRLERWLDDPEVKRSVGRGLPKLALLPKKHQKLV